MRQSAALWFQPACSTSACAPARSLAPSGASTRLSVLAVTGLEMRFLAQARAAAGNPVGDPVDHPVEGHLRRSEQALRRRGIDDPGGGRFAAGQLRRLAQTLAEFFREPAHADPSRSGDVQRAGRRRAMREQAKRLLVRLALPDYVYITHIYLNS